MPTNTKQKTRMNHSVPAKQKHDVGELRQDIITGQWVVIATGRAKRPDDFAADHKKPTLKAKYKEDCPFCNLAKFPQAPDALRLPDDPENWQVHIFENKYPAFTPRDEFRVWQRGPYRAMESVGYHELLATRWHNHVDGLLSIKQLALEMEALVLRYRQLKIKPSVNYIQIIKNHGEEAGGSLEHPHNQIFTVPILPRDVADILRNSEEYFRTYGRGAFETVLEFEQESKERVVWQNEDFLVFCPFASRVPFETWIVPKTPQQFFEELDPRGRESLAEAMQQVFGRLYSGLNDPPYNYYIHSAPCDETGFVCDREQFKHFRWHIEVLPRFTKPGGFELGTGLEINTTLPEEAAAFLREQSLPNLTV